MTQTVLIDSGFEATPEEIVAALDAAEFDERSIHILDLSGDERPARMGKTPGLRRSDLSRSQVVFTSSETGRRYLVWAVEEADLKRFDQLLQQIMNRGLDVVCLATDASNFPVALRQLERSLFVLFPQISAHNVRASYQFFAQVFEETVAPHGVFRDPEEASQPFASLWSEPISHDSAPKGPKPRTDEADGKMLSGLEVGDVAYVRGNRFSEDAMRVGLKFVRERVQNEGQTTYLRAIGDEGIVFYGPYLQVSPGNYVVTVSIDTDDSDLNALDEGELRLRMDVSYSGGQEMLREIEFTLDINQGPQEIEVPFEVSPEIGDSVTIETRLWTIEGYGRYQLLSYHLREIAPSSEDVAQ